MVLRYPDQNWTRSCAEQDLNLSNTIGMDLALDGSLLPSCPAFNRHRRCSPAHCGFLSNRWYPGLTHPSWSSRDPTTPGFYSAGVFDFGPAGFHHQPLLEWLGHEGFLTDVELKVEKHLSQEDLCKASSFSLVRPPLR